MKYDYLLVGGGLFNAVLAREVTNNGMKCLVVEKKPHLGGGLYCTNIEGVNVHEYGAHIFHTNNKNIWDYMSGLCEFNHYINSPLARYRDKLYNLPFNMNTFYQLWGTILPEEAITQIEKQRIKNEFPANFEEQALSLVGTDVYEILIKGYTEKQWGKDARELPSFIIKRIPLRFTYNNNYFDDPYQGIPQGGYNPIIQKCFAQCDILLNTDFTKNRYLRNEARKIIYTGMIDQYFDYCFGALEYRSLHFEKEILNMANYQGNAVVNFTEKVIPYTRIIEHKHFEFGNQEKTVISKEYPLAWKEGVEPFYPVNTEDNNQKYHKYKEKAISEKNIFFAGRLGAYQYYDMDQTVWEALKLYHTLK